MSKGVLQFCGFGATAPPYVNTKWSSLVLFAKFPSCGGALLQDDPLFTSLFSSIEGFPLMQPWILILDSPTYLRGTAATQNRVLNRLFNLVYLSLRYRYLIFIALYVRIFTLSIIMVDVIIIVTPLKMQYTSDLQSFLGRSNNISSFLIKASSCSPQSWNSSTILLITNLGIIRRIEKHDNRLLLPPSSCGGNLSPERQLQL